MMCGAAAENITRDDLLVIAALIRPIPLYLQYASGAAADKDFDARFDRFFYTLFKVVNNINDNVRQNKKKTPRVAARRKGRPS